MGSNSSQRARIKESPGAPFVISNVVMYWLLAALFVCAIGGMSVEIVSMYKSDRLMGALYGLFITIVFVGGIRELTGPKFGRWTISNAGVIFKGIWGIEKRLNWDEVDRVRWRPAAACLRGRGMEMYVSWQSLNKPHTAAREFVRGCLQPAFDLTETPNISKSQIRWTMPISLISGILYCSIALTIFRSAIRKSHDLGLLIFGLFLGFFVYLPVIVILRHQRRRYSALFGWRDRVVK